MGKNLRRKTTFLNIVIQRDVPLYRRCGALDDAPYREGESIGGMAPELGKL
jgi:hypothetical protein